MNIVMLRCWTLGAQKKHYGGFSNGGVQALSPEENAIFFSRLAKIWKGVMTFPMCLEWKDRFASFPSEVWQARIAEHTPNHVKSMLASPQAPKLTQLESLGWSDTTAAGVYGCYFSSNKRSVRAKKARYLYIGSATAYPGGLSARRRKILLPSSLTQKDSLKSKMRNLDLSLQGEFFKLFEVPFNYAFGDGMSVRGLAILARMVFTIWLGSFDEGLKPAIRDLTPWGLETIGYFGLAVDNPLATDFDDGDGRRKRERLGNKE
jgi:hypothetical protein